ncbi:Phosphate-binding protein PstS [Seminavis robusta]|uniref:Phosphate-binding protein PstS n=1 Tax=Seminavis robusta TaxID=568900 RepID=A0A9N8DIU2_9STRA|nr:Phosphate-binding protein PstS [Seminavis robusta]|eukprot:Sro108_g054360.1 Phosphate-binding protein PstS (758) ;mRNA; f:112108-114588
MKTLGLSVLFAVLPSVAASSQLRRAQVECPEDGTIKIGGTQSVQRLAQAWKDAYMMKNASTNQFCPLHDIRIEGVGYATGAARVCGIQPIYDNLDLAGMSGPFFAPQATSDNGWSFDCSAQQHEDDAHRKATLIRLAHEGIALVAAANGTASRCIEHHLGGGITTTQLRWIFSSYNEKLMKSLSDAVPFSDGDIGTHLWSELNEGCTETEIMLASVGVEYGAASFLTDHVLYGHGETIRTVARVLDHEDTKVYYTFPTVQDSLEFLENHTEAIAFIQLRDLHSSAFRDHADKIQAVAIKDNHNGEPILPEAEAFDNNQYPLSRAMYLGVHNDPASLRLTAPFLEFGLSEEGTKILSEAGFWALDTSDSVVMKTRLQIPGGVPMQEIQDSCGPEYGRISMAGSATVFPVAQIWSDVYNLGCPTVDISIEQGGSSAGAGRVCANLHKGPPVTIGTMSREWKGAEGKEHQYVYDCLKGDTSRSAVKVDVAYDGITVILKKGGIADQCQQILGGFTIDQLRWIYSGYSESALEATGWNATSLKNSDNDTSTHLWSELHPDCAKEEIRLAGDILTEGTHTNFRKTIMADKANGEDIDVSRPKGYFQALGFTLVAYLQSHGDAIAYIGFNYYHDNKELLAAAPIQNQDGVYVLPSAETIGGGTYNPLVRSISMNLLNDREALRDTVPLLKFGFSQPDLVTATGMVPVQGESLQTMLDRLDRASSGDLDLTSSALHNSVSSWRGSCLAVSLFFAGLHVLHLISA